MLKIGDTVTISKKRRSHPNKGALFVAVITKDKWRTYYRLATSIDVVKGANRNTLGVTHSKFVSNELILCRTMLIEMCKNA